jgi:predicted cupin superfamily sugar epimerase
VEVLQRAWEFEAVGLWAAAVLKAMTTSLAEVVEPGSDFQQWWVFQEAALVSFQPVGSMEAEVIARGYGIV